MHSSLLKPGNTVNLVSDIYFIHQNIAWKIKVEFNVIIQYCNTIRINSYNINFEAFSVLVNSIRCLVRQSQTFTWIIINNSMAPSDLRAHTAVIAIVHSHLFVIDCKIWKDKKRFSLVWNVEPFCIVYILSSSGFEPGTYYIVGYIVEEVCGYKFIFWKNWL